MITILKVQVGLAPILASKLAPKQIFSLASKVGLV